MCHAIYYSVFSHILAQLNSLANFNCAIFGILRVISSLHVECAQVWVFMTSWTAVHQAPLSMGFFSQEYWRVLLFPPPGDLPNPGSNLCLLHLLLWQTRSVLQGHRVSISDEPVKINTDLCEFTVHVLSIQIIH